MYFLIIILNFYLFEDCKPCWYKSHYLFPLMNHNLLKNSKWGRSKLLFFPKYHRVI